MRWIIPSQQPSRALPRRALSLFYALVLPSYFLLSSVLAADQATLLGTWYGELAIPNAPDLRMALEVTERADGTLTADLISIDQGADGAPSSQVTFAAPVARVEIRRPKVVIEGDLSEDGQTFAAQFRQGTFSAPLPLERVARVPGFALRWQTPVRPYPYGEEEVTYLGGAPGVSLAGTLTLPQGEGPHPAVVLVSGSGPQGRDELIGYHRPFLVLADYLTRRGIGVLRYDDRGVGQSTGVYATATTADFADDALAGVTYLRSRSDIDRDQIGIIGHSEGGMVAPMVAAQMPELGFIVLLAGPGIPIDELIVTQIGDFALAAGATETEVDVLRAMHRVIHRALNSLAETAAVYDSIHAYYDGLSAADRALLGWSKGTLNGVIENRLTPWWRYFLAFDPAVYLRQVKIPVLALNGDQDLNVAAENLVAIDRTLGMAGNGGYRVVELPGLNHMLNSNGEGEPADTTRPVETISPEVLELVSSWIRQHVGLASAGTAVAVRSEALPPLALQPNYPNPFNGTTTIPFSLPRGSTVELVVYNLAGQRVATLFRGGLEAGTHAVGWDGNNDTGFAVASGLYVYQLKAGSQLARRQLLVVR